VAERQEITEEEYPSNSLKTRRQRAAAEEEKPKVQRIVRGRAIKRKKSLGSSLAKTFLGDDTKSVGAYILHDVLIPAAKSTIQDMITGGIEMLLFGERSERSSRRRRRGGGTGSIVSYSSYYKEREGPKRHGHSESRREKSRGLDEIIIDDRREAEDVLEALKEMLDTYEMVSVSDLMDLVGFDNTDWVDTKWGWDDLRGSRIVRARGGDGYLLDLPDPISLE
jgi:hypothetical protein